jgi:hypothetical protein
VHKERVGISGSEDSFFHYYMHGSHNGPMLNKNIVIKLTLIHKTSSAANVCLLDEIIQLLTSGSQVSERRKNVLFKYFP